MQEYVEVRLTAAQLRLPRKYGIMLTTVALMSFLLIGIASSSDEKRAYIPILIFVLAFMAVFLIVVDLDRPQEGFVTVSRQSMSDLLQSMTASGS